jgi:hypothetical protein
MTPSAFMSDAAWLEIAEQRAKGIRAMPVIQDHPEWWVLDILDGYGSHFSSPEALAIYWALKIRQAKEEGHTSHTCQFYDQEPAKKDEVVLRSGTAMLRQAASVSKGVVDQWGLVAVGLMAVRSGTKDPQMWIDAAKKTNLHPGFGRPFAEWLEEKRGFLQGGLSFKLEDYSADVYPLLPRPVPHTTPGTCHEPHIPQSYLSDAPWMRLLTKPESALFNSAFRSTAERLSQVKSSLYSP